MNASVITLRTSALLCLCGTTLLLSSASLAAETLYWNKEDNHLVWSINGNQNWTNSPNGTTYTGWTTGSNAVISSNSRIISFGGSYVEASSLTVLRGAQFRNTGSGNVGVRISGADGSSGSGDFSMIDNSTSTASLRIFLQSHTADSSGYNGTITVNSLSDANSGLYLGLDGKGAAADDAFTGTDANTRIVLNGGTLFLNGGLANKTATIGSLSGTGKVALGGVFSLNSGTRTLRVEQNTNSVFGGSIGGHTISQSSNAMAFTKAGSGRLVIRATEESGFSGTTRVEDGALRLEGTFGSTQSGGNNVNQGDLIAASGGTLGLDGTFNLGSNRSVIIEEGGILEAGRMVIDAAGTTASRGLVFEGNAEIAFTLGAGPGTSLITLVDGSMTGSSTGVAGGIVFTFNGADIEVGQSFELIRFGASSMIGLNEYALSGQSIADGWNGIFSYSDSDRVLSFTVTAIPESGSVALAVAGGAVALCLMRCYRGKAAKRVRA